MSETGNLLERVGAGFAFPDGALERLERRRDRKRRNERIASGVAGIAILVVLLFGLRAVLDHTREPAHPGPSPSGTEKPTLTERTLTLDGQPGIYLFDVQTGAATRVPDRITDVALRYAEERRYQATPDGSGLLFMGRDDAGRSQVFLASIDGNSLQQLTNEPIGAEAASLSPDGRRIVYIALSGTSRSDLPADLVVMEIATGQTTVVVHADGQEYPFGRNEIQYPRFAPDGRTIVFTRGAHGYDLYSVPFTGGEPTLLLRDGYDAVYSPDGTTIAFHRAVAVSVGRGGASESQIWLADADGGDPRAFGGVGTYAPTWSPDGSRIAFRRLVRSNETVDGAPVGSTGPGSDSLEGDVLVLDLATGAITAIVGAEAPASWLDDRTLIVSGGGRA